MASLCIDARKVKNEHTDDFILEWQRSIYITKFMYIGVAKCFFFFDNQIALELGESYIQRGSPPKAKWYTHVPIETTKTNVHYKHYITTK